MLQPHPARHAIVQACLCAALSSPAVLSAHEATEHCAAVTHSVVEAGFTERVAVTCENGTAILSSDTYPDHDMMTGITGTNEQVPVPAESYDAPIPLTPRLGDTPLTRDAALGVRSTACRSLIIPAAEK